MKEKERTKLHTYVLINYSKPPPVFPELEIEMTEREAHARNQGFSFNRVTKALHQKVNKLYRRTINWLMSTRLYKYLLKHIIPYIRFTTYYTSLRGKKYHLLYNKLASR